MSVPLSELLTELPEVTRNSTSGALDNSKRTRAINRILQDLQSEADFEFTRRTKTFYFIEGVSEYSLENYLDCVCEDNDGSTDVLDFKNAYDLRPISVTDKSLSGPKDPKEVRENIRRGRYLGEYATDNELLIVGYPRQVSAIVNNCDSLTEDGAWAASGDASNLTVDDQEYKEGAGSLNFDTTSGTSLVITNSSLSSRDLETLQNKSHFVMWVYLPTITAFTSIKLRWGSSAADYWEKTETVPAGSTDLAVGWNRFAFRWAEATESGSPDATAVDYLQITLTYSSATTDTDFRIDDIRVGKEVEMEFEYYSLAMVMQTDGDYQLEFNADSVTMTDILLGGNTARNCVIEGAKHECFEIIGGKSERDRTDSYDKYLAKRNSLIKKVGHRLRRPARRLNFKR
jgi:hypothetical protein